MKSIHEKFTDEEFASIEQIKKDLDMSWHDFLLKIAQGYATEKKRVISGNVFEVAHVPETGRIRLTKAAGKDIEWRLKQ